MARNPERAWGLTLITMGWGFLTLGGMAALWRYEMLPGAVGAAPARLSIAPADSRYTLLVALHPHCPCSRATLHELSRIVTRCGPKLRIEALVIAPTNMPATWSETGLWRDAATIPNITLSADRDGEECQRLGAKTSGHAMLYSPSGALLFQGGITGARGHEGDNTGSDAVISAIANGVQNASTPTTTPVFGCPLQRDDQRCAACPPEGTNR